MLIEAGRLVRNPMRAERPAFFCCSYRRGFAMPHANGEQIQQMAQKIVRAGQLACAVTPGSADDHAAAHLAAMVNDPMFADLADCVVKFPDKVRAAIALIKQ